MKNTILILLIFLNHSFQAQEKKQVEFTYENFDKQILNYQPIRRKNVSASDYKKGIFKLNATKTSVKYDASQLNSADFWNITMAFVNLKEPKSHIAISFQKAISYKNNDICSYIDSFGPSSLDKIIPELYYEFYTNCTQERSEKSVIDLKTYSKENQLDYNLVLLIEKVKNNDSKYRVEKEPYYKDSIKLMEQKKLDSKNQQIIDSLYHINKSYIGKSSVGARFSFVMWSVIQHSNLEMMEKYLPIIAKAVKEKELDVVPFKMLLDRFHGLKYGYQIFGSQFGFGFKMADEKKRKEIELKYGIE